MARKLAGRETRGVQADPSHLAVLEGYTQGSSNPYYGLLREAMAEHGVDTSPLTGRRVVRHSVDVIHLHHPESLARRDTLRGAWLAVFRLVSRLLLARARRIQVVWTVHNAHAHDSPRPRLDRLVRGVVVRGVVGWIAMSEDAAVDAIRANPRLRRRPVRVIPHGHYRGAYPPPADRAAARRTLDLPRQASVVLYFGQIRPYKNVPRLIEAFRGLDGGQWRLIVAGRVVDEDIDTLMAAVGDDERVDLRLGFVSDEDLPALFGASDLVVLPFREILNSGSALLALSFDTPVLVPRFGSLISLERQIGAPWVQTYDGEVSSAVIEEAHVLASEAQGSAPMDPFSWEVIGEATASFYRELIAVTGTATGRR
jgi:beta-1,4-mannosyltransferase